MEFNYPFAVESQNQTPATENVNAASAEAASVEPAATVEEASPTVDVTIGGGIAIDETAVIDNQSMMSTDADEVSDDIPTVTFDKSDDMFTPVFVAPFQNHIAEIKAEIADAVTSDPEGEDEVKTDASDTDAKIYEEYKDEQCNTATTLNALPVENTQIPATAVEPAPTAMARVRIPDASNVPAVIAPVEEQELTCARQFIKYAFATSNIEGSDKDKIKGIVSEGITEMKYVHPRLTLQFLYSELMKLGFIACFDDQNREIVESHVNKLYNDVKDSKDKTFAEPGKIVSAKRLLQEGKTLHDAAGNEITLDTPDLWKYYVILDAQHRVMVCNLHLEIDLYLEIAHYDCNTNEYYALLNNTRRDHSGHDQKQMIQKQNPTATSLFDSIDSVKDSYGVTDKCAESWLTGHCDQFKKSELTRVQRGKQEVSGKYTVDQMKLKTAMTLLAVIKLAYTDSETHKFFKKYQFPLAVWSIYDGLDEDDQKSFDTDMSLFLKNETATVSNLVAHVGDSTFPNQLRRAFSKFKKQLAKDGNAETLKAELDNCFEELGEEGQPAAPKSGKVKALKSGAFHIVYKNMLEIQKKKDAAVQKKADKALKNKDKNSAA